MKKNWLLIILAVIYIVACKNKDKTTTQENTGTTTSITPPDPKKDSVEIRQVVTDFYNRYSKNFEKLEKFQLYSSIKKKEQPPYKINWDVVDKYQQFIRDSVPGLGEEFLSNQKEFFMECDSAFKKDLEDDIPYGFDYDWYTNSQEDAKYTVDEINRAPFWNMTINGDNAIVDIKGIHHEEERQIEETVMKLAMKRENGKWKIAKIGLE